MESHIVEKSLVHHLFPLWPQSLEILVHCPMQPPSIFLDKMMTGRYTPKYGYIAEYGGLLSLFGLL